MKKIIKIISFILIACGVILLTYKVLSWKDTTGAYISSIEQLKNTPDNTIDVVFVGSSHVYCGVAPHVLWEDAGISAFDLSISGMDRYSAYYHTKHMLKTQRPKVVAVDLFPIIFDKHEDLANEYRNMMSMPFSRNAVELVSAYSELNKAEVEEEPQKIASDYLTRWPIIHTRYKELQKGDFFKTPENTYIRGEGLNFGISGVDLSVTRSYTDAGDLTKEQMQWLDSFIDLADEYGFRLVFFVCPYSAQYRDMLLINAAGEYVSGRDNVTYINEIFDNSYKLDCEKDFYDFGHLNAEGAKKHTRWLYKKVLKQLNLKNHKGDPKYIAWEQDVSYQMCQEVNENINSLLEGSFQEDAASVIQGSGHLVYTLVFNERWTKYPLVYTILHNLGYKDSDFKGGGVLVGKGNTVLLVHDGIGEKEVSYDYDRYNSLRVKGNGVFIDEVRVGMKDYITEGTSVTMALWDINVQRMIMEKSY